MVQTRVAYQIFCTQKLKGSIKNVVRNCNKCCWSRDSAFSIYESVYTYKSVKKNK